MACLSEQATGRGVPWHVLGNTARGAPKTFSNDGAVYAHAVCKCFHVSCHSKQATGRGVRWHMLCNTASGAAVRKWVDVSCLSQQAIGRGEPWCMLCNTTGGAAKTLFNDGAVHAHALSKCLMLSDAGHSAWHTLAEDVLVVQLRHCLTMAAPPRHVEELRLAVCLTKSTNQ